MTDFTDTTYKTTTKRKVKTNLLGPSYTINVKLDGTDILTYVDSGSVVSTVTEDFVRRHIGSEIKPLSDLSADSDISRLSFVTANGDNLDYLGYVSASMTLPSVNTLFDALLLVIPDTGHDHVLLGTNILQLLDPDEISNGVLSKAVSYVNKLCSDFNLVRSNLVRTKFNKHSINFGTGKLRVKPAKFVRTVMLSPTEKARSVKDIVFADVCVDIPRGISQVDVPFRVVNSSDHNVFLGKKFPIYSVECVDKVDRKDEDPRNATLPDDEFLKLFNLDYDNFSEQEIDRMHRLILKYKSLFALNSYQLGCLKGAEYKIELLDDKPVKQRYRPIPPQLHDKVQEQLQVMLDSKVIKESTSPWNSPLTVVRKKNNDLRLCVDYRALNKQCKKDAKPLPRIDETLESLREHKYFSTCDLLSGYWQIALSEESKDCTAFSAGSEKLYSFERIPFGHSGSGSFFQRSIEEVLKNLLFKYCVVYLDDILITGIGKSFDVHCDALDLVFQRLLDSGLKLKPQKCDLFKTSIKYLGFVVSDDGIRTDSDKTKVIQDWEVPTNTRDVRKFLGVVGYFRKFIADYSKRAAPLTDLLKGKLITRGTRKKFDAVEFYWNKPQQDAFEDLKEALLADVCLEYPDYSLPFVLEIDASRGGLGAVLSQKHDGKLRPIAFASRKTSPSEVNYPSHKLEFLALKWAVTQKFKDYLHQSFCDIYTDNNPVAYMVNKMNIDATSQRWCAELAKYDFLVHYRTGKSNTAADSLSRLTEPEKVDQDALKDWCRDIISKDCKSIMVKDNIVSSAVVKAVLLSAECNFPTSEQCYVSAIQNKVSDVDYSESVLDKAELVIDDDSRIDWHEVQKQDKDIQYIINNVVKNCRVGLPEVRTKNAIVKTLYRRRDQLSLVNGLLCKTSTTSDKQVSKQLVLNKSCLPELLRYYHDNQDHLGEDRTVHILVDRFYWPCITSDVKSALKNCKTCLARKTLPCRNKTEMNHRAQAKYPMDIVAMDHLVIDGREGKTLKVLTIVDEYSKFLFVVPVRKENAEVTADVIIRNIFMKYGIPNVIHTDNGKAFCNRIVNELLNRCGVKHSTSTPYHSMGNAVAERCQQVILNMLGTLKPAEKQKWHNHCDYISYAYNTSVHVSTGLTPYFLMFGRHPRLIGDAILDLSFEQPSHKTVSNFMGNLQKAYKICEQKLKEKQLKYKQFYDAKLSKDIVNLKVDDIVLVKNQVMSNKIDNRWCSSPYIVISQPNDDIPVYKVREIESNIVKVKHRNQLLPLYRAQDVVRGRTKKLVKRRTDKRSARSGQSSLSSSHKSDVGSVTSSGVDVVIRRQPPGSVHVSDVPSQPESSDNDVVRHLDGMTESDLSTETDLSTDSDEDERVVGRSRFGRKIRQPLRFSPTSCSVKVFEVFV